MFRHEYGNPPRFRLHICGMVGNRVTSTVQLGNGIRAKMSLLYKYHMGFLSLDCVQESRSFFRGIETANINGKEFKPRGTLSAVRGGPGWRGSRRHY